MHTRNILLFSLGILLSTSVFAGLTVFSTHTPSGTVLPAATENFSVRQTVTYGDGRNEADIIPAATNQSVLDILSKSNNITVKETTMGKLIESIGGETNGSDNKYWMYYVNGKEATVGAADYIVRANDAIEWKFKAYEQ